MLNYFWFSSIPFRVYAFPFLRINLYNIIQIFLNPAAINYSDLQFLGDEPLGGGGSGTVWKGKWKSGGNLVAIKKVMQLVKREVGPTICMQKLVETIVSSFKVVHAGSATVIHLELNLTDYIKNICV